MHTTETTQVMEALSANEVICTCVRQVFRQHRGTQKRTSQSSQCPSWPAPTGEPRLLHLAGRAIQSGPKKPVDPDTSKKLGREALADSRRYFFFFAGLSDFSDFSDFLAFSGLLSAFFADFLGSASFFFSFLSEDLESVEAAADFFAGDDFLSFKSLLAFEASPLLFFSSLATLITSRSVPILAHGLCDYSQANH